MAPAIAAVFAAAIFMLIKLVVLVRRNPIPWAVWTSPFFFLLAGVVCTLSVVYKGSPRLGLDKRPAWFIAAVTLGVGFGLFVLSALFFVPYVHAKVMKKDYTVALRHVVLGPLLFKRQPPADAVDAKVPNYAVCQHGDDHDSPGDGDARADEGPFDPKNDHPEKPGQPTSDSGRNSTNNTNNSTNNTNNNTNTNNTNTKKLILAECHQDGYRRILFEARERHHAKLRRGRGPLAWAMRTLRANPMGAGSLYEKHNMVAACKRLPATVVAALLYGMHYDIHGAQVGIEGTPEGRRMQRVYECAKKYPNEVEYLYSFVQIITACTASFAHGANDVGNAVGVWAAMYSAWSTGKALSSSSPVELWQIAVMALTICAGFITYGYNIMKVMGNKITYHSPSRGSSMEMGAAVTVLVFSQYSLPVSTSMCITGATVGVGLCNGTFRAVNWQRVGLLVFSWIMTIPIAGLIGGCLMGILLNTPHFA
ncbi:hypothetical protein E4U41_001663 [Claviceps citrina]|nr:hypothetical protein E4U41_001663 [Claviceps citrina]